MEEKKNPSEEDKKTPEESKKTPPEEKKEAPEEKTAEKKEEAPEDKGKEEDKYDFTKKQDSAPDESKEPAETEAPKEKKGRGKLIAGVIVIIVIAALAAYSLNLIPTGFFIFDSVQEEPAKSGITVLSDERCKNCNVQVLVENLKEVFPEMELNELDYSSPEGKKLFDGLGLEFLPAVLFDETVKEEEGYPSVQNFLEETGDYLKLNIGAGFDPTKEICDNEIDDTGNSLVDCKDPDCEQSMECREELPANLQVFIMSDCPYGRKAVEALKEVADNFGDTITYEVHYIASESGDGFSSLHGQYEVDEDIIQLCVLEHSPEQWMDYMYCRATKGVNGKDWNDCASETGVDVEAVQACFDGEEGASLLAEDIKAAKSLGISASPTWLANNRYLFSGIYAESIKTDFCTYNPGLEGCENTLSSDGTTSGSC